MSISLIWAGRETLVHRAAGRFPAIFLRIFRGEKKGQPAVAEKVLSVFIDESGDFGAYEHHAPYYLVAMVLHDQDVNIAADIQGMNERMRNLGYDHHAIHTGPLIRRESVYANDTMEARKHLFNILYYFSRKLNFHYICTKIKKSECPDEIVMTAKLSKAIAEEIRSNARVWENFDRVIIYYDNGQIELTKILTSVFSTLYTHVEFRRVEPVNYKLFQVADLVCTMELLAEKAAGNRFSKSESEFFGGTRDFRKDYLKGFQKKKL